MKVIHQKQISDIFHKPSQKKIISSSQEEKNKNISKIIVDNRERNSLVPSELIKMEIPIEFQQLKVADYIINNTAIERKTISDFGQNFKKTQQHQAIKSQRRDSGLRLFFLLQSCKSWDYLVGYFHKIKMYGDYKISEKGNKAK